ncbi:MAG: glutathione S-transferase family protein [Rhodobacteraceae bacterium]|nr:glutathione S-transferase family protein [Paracoccaceae bacterium]
MVVIVPSNKSVESLQGLHLYHGAISNCSMRVRMTLVEKGLEWTSHHIDLKKKENITDEYFGINPNGLVPTLIDDGVVHIESNDIIDYLDATYPEPSLRVTDNDAMMRWLHLAAAIHIPACKPYVYATKIAKKIRKSAAEQVKYDSLQKNEELKRFHSKHAGDKEFSTSDLEKATAVLDACFTKLEVTLENQDWIMGDRFSLADISWVPLYFVISGCGFSFDKFPNIKAWAAAFEDRESYREGILRWCPDFSRV